MQRNFLTPGRNNFSEFDDISLESNVDDSPVARSPSSPTTIVKKNMFNYTNQEDSFAIHSDEDSCITNYDLKQLFHSTKAILDEDEKVIKSIPKTGFIQSEASLDSMMTKEEKHILQSHNLEKEISTAVDRLAYGHVSCREWTVLTPATSKRNMHDKDPQMYTRMDSTETNIIIENMVEHNDTDGGILSKIMDVLCCNSIKDIATL